MVEFVQFKERLQHSSQYLMARLEASILQLKLNANNIEEEEVLLFPATLWSKCFNFYVNFVNGINYRYDIFLFAFFRAFLKA